MTVSDRLDRRACPDAEQLAAYADGALGVEDRAAIEAHLVECADCRNVLAETMAFSQAASASNAPAAPRVIPFRSRRWVTGAVAGLAAAAAIVLAVRVARPEWLGLGSHSDRPELQELVSALANEPTRPVEGRLTGGFKYAPPPSPTRGPGQVAVRPDVRSAATIIRRRYADDPWKAGVASLVIGDLDQAIDLLEAAAHRQPGNAAVQNDLSVAYLERGRRFKRLEDLLMSLTASSRATEIAPTLLAAQFNGVLVLEALGRTAEAIDGWRHYQSQVDETQWREEGVRRLSELERRK